MSRLYSLTSLKERRRLLRRQATPSENKFWMFLRNREFRGLKFRRQHSVGWYILDFYCPALQLAIEVDGESHLVEGRDVLDKKRQEWIEAQGIRVVRFLSSEVIHNMDGVIKRLGEVIDEMS